MHSSSQSNVRELADVSQTNSQAAREADFTAIFGQTNKKAGSRKRAHSIGVPLTSLKRMATGREQTVNSQLGEAPQQQQQLPNAGQDNMSVQILEALGSMNRNFNKRFSAVEKSMSELEKNMDHKIESLISDIKTTFSKEVNDVKSELKADLHRLENEMDVLKVSYAEVVRKTDLPDIAHNLSQPANTLEKNFVIMNLPFSENEIVKEKVDDMLSQDLGLPNIKISDAKRIPTRSKKFPGIVVATCNDTEQKSSVMANKNKLARSSRYSNVFINNDKSKADRKAERNLKTLVRAMADDSLTVRNGMVVNKNTVPNVPSSLHQGVASNHSGSNARFNRHRASSRQST